MVETLVYTTAGVFFFINHAATTEIYTLSLHDALPIWSAPVATPGEVNLGDAYLNAARTVMAELLAPDRKSTRLNSSHQIISYAVFCLKKKASRSTAEFRVARRRRLHRDACAHPSRRST